jgi:hypothetical protein
LLSYFIPNRCLEIINEMVGIRWFRASTIAYSLTLTKPLSPFADAFTSTAKDVANFHANPRIRERVKHAWYRNRLQPARRANVQERLNNRSFRIAMGPGILRGSRSNGIDRGVACQLAENAVAGYCFSRL